MGSHDENIAFDRAVATIGADLAERVREVTLAIYRFAADYAAERGILIADTKFEFGHSRLLCAAQPSTCPEYLSSVVRRATTEDL